MKIMHSKIAVPILEPIRTQWFNLVVLLIFFQFSCFAQKGSSIYCSSVFSDHMVIQQGIHSTVWGSAKNTNKVVIEYSGTKTEASVSKANGNWMAKLPVFQAGGPSEMKVRAIDTNDSIVFHDVMVGEVWVASGQSNMQFNMPGVRNAEEEIKNANYPDIRFLQVECNMSSHPLNTMKGSWKAVDPESVKELSAVAYFFARQLHREKNVAVGIIISAWGGTPVEAWTSADMLSVMPDLKEKIRLNAQENQDWSQLYRNYIGQDSSLRHSAVGENSGVPQMNYKADTWETTEIPLNTDNLHLRQGYYGGYIWLRKPFDWTEIKSSCKLYIKHVNGEIDVYINGRKLEKPTESNHSLGYTIPENILRKGKNLLAVRHFSLWAFGKIMGDKKDDITVVANNGSTMALDGKWYYNENIEPKFPAFPVQKDYPTSLFNAMINPVIPFGIKGVIWYQGESNVGEPARYQLLFPMLINDWRIRWQLGSFPFLFVQLANFGPRNTEPVSDNWALLREAQTQTLSYPNTGMAVTIDIGETNDIHPKNKQDVGKRLYLAARKVAYNENLVSGGPMYRGMMVEGNKIRICFTDAGSGLVANGNTPLKGFSIAGADKQFYWANAEIEGNNVVVSSDKVQQPVAVRYAWSANPKCNLYNQEDLPASPFRTDNW